MSTGIYLVDSDNKLLEMTEQPYPTEDLLQELLADHPSLLAGGQIDSASPRRWLLVSREAGVPDGDDAPDRWAVDHVFLDQDAIPTLVEVKRSSDTRIRREVVGQMLDYAANAVIYWPAEHLRDRFEETCRTSAHEPAAILRETLGIEDVEAFWNTAKTNLQTGKLRLVFVADLIPRELQRVVEFLNEQMDPAEVLAVEIKQYVGGTQRTLVPRVLGLTEEARRNKSSAARERRKWDETTFFDELSLKSTPAEVKVGRDLLEWAKHNATRVWWGEGMNIGSFSAIARAGNEDHQMFGLYTGISGSGSVEIQLQYLKARQAFRSDGSRLELLRRVNEAVGTSFGSERIADRPNFPLSALTNPERLSAFLEVWNAFIKQLEVVRPA